MIYATIFPLHLTLKRLKIETCLINRNEIFNKKKFAKNSNFLSPFIYLQADGVNPFKIPCSVFKLFILN